MLSSEYLQPVAQELGVSVLIARIRALGATPCTPVSSRLAAMTLDTNVPCQVRLRSLGERAGEPAPQAFAFAHRSKWLANRPASCVLVTSKPPSITATVTPLPFAP